MDGTGTPSRNEHVTHLKMFLPPFFRGHISFAGEYRWKWLANYNRRSSVSFFLVERFELVLFILSADGGVKLRIREKITELWRKFSHRDLPVMAGSLMARLFVKRFYRWKQSIVRSRRVKFGWKKSRSSLGPVLLAGSSLPEWPLLQAPSGRDHQWTTRFTRFFFVIPPSLISVNHHQNGKSKSSKKWCFQIRAVWDFGILLLQHFWAYIPQPLLGGFRWIPFNLATGWQML